ncbi:MAG: DUF2334 domain-containing protein [Candidatus Gracilibacteria bacterium]|jgi:hypothetical protein
MKKILILTSIILGIAFLCIGGYAVNKYWNNKTDTSLCGNGQCGDPEKIEESIINNEQPETTKEIFGIIVIHMEPGTDPEEQKNLTNPETYWSNLVSLVETADQYDIKLTLLFNPQWAEYILKDSTKLTLLREWEADGHEIGYHQHEPSKGSNWNGYTNIKKYETETSYEGTIDDAMELLTQLPANGKIYTAGMSGTDEEREYDWPIDIPYRVDGVTSDEILNEPTTETIREQTIWHISHSIFIPGEKESTLENIEKTMDEAKSGQVIGIVFHAQNFTDQTKSDYEKLFALFGEKNITEETVRNILENQ